MALIEVIDFDTGEILTVECRPPDSFEEQVEMWKWEFYEMYMYTSDYPNKWVNTPEKLARVFARQAWLSDNLRQLGCDLIAVINEFGKEEDFDDEVAFTQP